MGRRIRALLALALLAACAAPRSALAAQPGQPRSALRDAAANPHGRGAHKVHNALELVQMHGAHPLPDPSVRLRVNSTKLKRSGQWFEVSWSGVPSPDFGDWVGLFPAAADPLWSAAPLKYDIAAKARNHMRRGSGKLRFRMISYRQDVRFAFMRGGLMAPRMVAVGEVIRVVNPNEPLQGRLALTGNGPSEMLVQWSTRNSSRPVVKWGPRRGELTQLAEAASHTYTRDEMCGPPANTVGWIDPGLVHVAKLTGLEPGRKYYYKFGDEDWGFSQVFKFRAAPPEGPDTTVKFLAIADLGQAEPDGSLEEAYYAPSLNTTRLMFEEGDSYQLLLHNGDISYARGYVSQWDNFHDQMAPLVTRMPYMVAPGNHERNWPGTHDRFHGRAAVYDSGGECGISYERRMTMPIAGPDKPWYAFTLGPVRFVQYSTEHALWPGSEQHDWITQELERTDRSVTPWLVVSGHRPLYISSTNNWVPDGDQPAAQEARDALEGLLMDYRADLTLHGHHHSYQRTCPVYKGVCRGYDPQEDGGAARAPVHLVIGHAGAALSTNVPLEPSPIWETIKFWWGYSRVEASAARMRVEVVSDLDGRLLDSFTLRKPKGWGEKFMAARRAAARVAEE